MKNLKIRVLKISPKRTMDEKIAGIIGNTARKEQAMRLDHDKTMK